MAGEHSGAQVSVGLLRIFVYGTLKRGYWNHDRFCRDAHHIEEGTVRGRLYGLPSGIPVLHVPDAHILAVGTSDALADVAMQEAFHKLPHMMDGGASGWGAIQGELMVLAEAGLSLPPIDRLEGFRPGGRSLYRRVLVPVLIDGGRRVPAWCYVAGERLDTGASPSDKTSWP